MAVVVICEGGGERRQSAPGKAGIEGGGIVPDQANIMHGRALSAPARRRKPGTARQACFSQSKRGDRPPTIAPKVPGQWRPRIAAVRRRE